jgi:hypothetical protein
MTFKEIIEALDKITIADVIADQESLQKLLDVAAKLSDFKD